MKNRFLLDEHMANIFRAAMPHVHPQIQSSMNLLLKANDLMDTIQEASAPSELSTMGLDAEPVNPEELLTSIRPACNSKEMEFVDMILNFLKAGKLYNAYRSYNSEELQAADIGTSAAGGRKQKSLKDFLVSQLTPEQRSTVEMFNMVMNQSRNSSAEEPQKKIAPCSQGADEQTI